LHKNNPYRTDPARLIRTIQLLGLIDQDKRPLGRLRAVWEGIFEEIEPKYHKSELSTNKESIEPIITEEDDEIKQEIIKKDIFVGNLNYNATEKDLENLFGKFGSVRSVKIPMDLYSGKSRGFAFVEMDNMVNAIVAKDNLDGCFFQGRNLYLGWGK
jgi:RNA recognition motif-containing protein